MTLARQVSIPLAILAVLVVGAPVATAHAWLLEAHPGPNQQVASPPDVLFLKFTEDVERDYTRAEVYDLNGTSMDRGEVLFDDDNRNQIIVPLLPLKEEVYTVRWSSLSVDTHTAHGTYVFAVGQASLEGAPGPTQEHVHGEERVAKWMESAGRTAHYAAVALIVGVPGFLLFVVRDPALGSHRRLLFWLAGGIGVLGAIGGAILLVASADRIGADAWNAASSTRTGQLLLARIAAVALGALVAAFLAFHKSQPNRASLTGLAMVGLAAILFTSFSSHAAAVSQQKALSIAVDVLHLAAGGLWIGGILTFLLLGRSADTSALALWVRRFSPLAVTSVIVIVLTGTFASTLHLKKWDDFTEGDYGYSLLTKILLLVPLLALGAANRYVVGPRLRAGGSPRTLTGTLAAETVLLAGVLIAAGVLATSAPPGSQLGAAQPPMALVKEQALETAHMVFSISPTPPRVGIQNFTVELHSYDGKANPNGTTVYLKFAPPGQPEPEEVHVMERAGPDRWTLRGGFFTERGNWTVYVKVQRPDEQASVPFTIEVSA